MLKLNDSVIINETQIVTAEFENASKTLKIVFSVPVSFAPQVEGNSNQVQLSGNEAENLWRILSKDAPQINPAPSGTSGGSQYAVGGKRPQFNPL